MKQCNQSRRAFTVIEVLAIITVLAIFGALLMPAFAQDNKTRVRALRCVDNHTQLIKAWLMYANDFEDYVANNYTLPSTQSAINKWRTTGVCDTWAPNLMVYTVGGTGDATTATNTALAPVNQMASAVAKKVLETVMTSSPAPMSRASRASQSASVHELTPIAVFIPK